MIRSLLRSSRRPLLGLALVSFAGAAAAHPDHGATSFVSGLAHPLLGLDHLLAMAAVGIWSATALRGARRAAAPLLFVAVMLAGALLGAAVGAVPFVEAAVAASVVLLGALLVAGACLETRTAAYVVVGAALLHGFVHGVDAAGSTFLAFAAGFVASTLLLQGAATAAGVLAQRARPMLAQLAGLAVGAAGVALLATRL